MASTVHHAATDIGIVARYLAPRWKAIVATVVPLLGGVIALIASNEFDLPHILGVLATAMTSGAFTHQVANVPVSADPAAAVDVSPVPGAAPIAAVSQDPDATVSS